MTQGETVRSRLLSGPTPVLLLVVAGAVAAAIRGGFDDIEAYQYGGRAVLDGIRVYEQDDPVTGLPFTYPPFGAVLLAPLTLTPDWLAAALVTGSSVGALAAVVVLTRRAMDRPSPGWLVALLTCAALALEPVWQNLTFGQVNLLLMLAILLDLVWPDRRWSGVLTGIAAGVKLTPLVFVVLLVMVGHRSAAARATLVFAGTVAVGFVVIPGSATTYWTEGLIDAGRVGPPELAHNQSVFGALTRILDNHAPSLLWLVVAGPLSIAVLLLAAARWRRGDRVLAACLGALAMLFASPVSWSHHWVWAAPAALALWERRRWASVAWTAVFVTRPVLWPPWGRAREYDWSTAEHLVGNAYLLVALATCVWAAVTLSRQAGTARPGCLPGPGSGSAGRRVR